MADGWVMRLGVPGRDAFRYSTEEHGYRKRLYGRIAAPSSSSMPQHELRGRFINLEDGLLVKSGTYATPPAACAEFRETMRDLVARATGGIVLRFPGFLEPMGDGFRRAAHLKKEYAGLGLETANFFWSANFAEQILELVSSAVNGARKITGGDDTDRVDALVEHSLSSIGRACWRELVLSAANAVYHRGRAAERPGATIGCHERQPGKLGLAVAEIAGYCREQQRPLHVVTEGAGALVLRDLIDLAEDSGVSQRELLGGLTSVTMLFPTIPVDETGSLLAHMEKLNRDVGGPAAAIVLPTRELEKTLNCRGYGKSVNQLVSHAFVDRHDGPPRPLLGMSRETIRDYLPARLDADLARRDEDLPADRRMKPARREKIVRSKAAEWRKRIRALAVEVGPEDLDQPAAVARGTRLITTDENISKIVRERLRSHSQGRPKGAEDRVQGPSGANGEGGSHGGGVGSLLHHDRGTGPVPAGNRDQLGERPEA